MLVHTLLIYREEAVELRFMVKKNISKINLEIILVSTLKYAPIL